MSAKITTEEYNEAVERSKIKAARGNPRPYSLVKFDWDNCPESVKPHRMMFELQQRESLIFVSEIPNSLGHCIVWKISRNPDSSESVTTYVGFHTDEFVELIEDEV